MLENIYKDKWQFLQDEWANEFFTHDNYVKSIHNAELAKKDEVIQEQSETLQETIKNLLKHNFSMEEISNITKLSIEKIKDIIN